MLAAPLVDGKERVGRRERRTFVAIDEGVALSKALPQCRRFFDYVCIIARLRPEQRCLEKTGISQSERSSVSFNLIGMNGENVGEREPVPHCASFL